MTKTKILLADDHVVVRKGLRFVMDREPDMEVVGEAGDGKEAVDLTGELRANVVVMDVAMPRLGGIDATAQITKKHPEVGVIILSMYSDEEYIVRALSAGAKGYLLKDSVESELVSAVRSVAVGRPFFSPAIAQMLLDDYLRQLQQRGLTDSYELLSDREKEVIRLLAEGKSNKDVAAILKISPYTVDTHRTRIMQKLNLHNTAEIVLYAVRKKIIS